MADTKKLLLSGVKPTGKLHIGNYFGAIAQFLEFQEEYESFIFIADYHALNSVHDPELLRSQVLDLAAGCLAAGIDPAKTTFYKQSDIPEHTELAWIFNTITPIGTLLRAHAYKDAQAKNKEVSVGTFDYPLLMAADILMYDPHVVPVGKDQKQHVEIARDTAERFNKLYGETFRLPEPRMHAKTLIVPGIDGQKMSKSYNNVIPLFATDEEIEKIVMSIVTDSSGERPEHVYAIHTLFRTESELAPLYESQRGNYKTLKEALAEDIKKFVRPKRKQYQELIENKKELLRILEEGAKEARTRAKAKMEEVREKIGVTLK